MPLAIELPKQAGYHYYGNEQLYNGMTGEEIEVRRQILDLGSGFPEQKTSLA